jgi:hypothetical protein
MRRVLELAGRSGGREALIIHAPKTRSPEAEDYFITEIRWLAAELEKAAGVRLDREELRRGIAVRNGIRGRLRLLRQALTGADFSALVYLEARLPAGEMERLASFHPVPPGDRRPALRQSPPTRRLASPDELKRWVWFVAVGDLHRRPAIDFRSRRRRTRTSRCLAALFPASALPVRPAQRRVLRLRRGPDPPARRPSRGLAVAPRLRHSRLGTAAG